MKALREKVIHRLPALVLVLLVIQPLLDVLSYFLMQWGSNTLSTLLRLGLLGVVGLLGFWLSPKKKHYIIFYGAAGLFWLLHMLNCARIGYGSVFEDTSNYLRILNFPVLTLSMVTFFQLGKGVRKSVLLGCAINFCEIVVFTALPWLMGTPIYTYSLLELGVMGWFGVPNAQCIVIVLLTPFLVFWSYRKGKYPLFVGTALAGAALLYVTGTKFTFYSIMIIFAAFIFVFFLRQGRKSLRFIVPLFCIMVFAMVLRTLSPMQEREDQSAATKNTYAGMVDESLKNSGVDEEVIAALKKGVSPDKTTDRDMEKIHRSLIGAYSNPMGYGRILEDLNQRFGVYRVMEAYHYTTSASILSDFRIQKQNAADLVWAEQDFLTKLLGFEYGELQINGSNYDLENDFPAIFYLCGYVGFGLYMLFFLYFLFVTVKVYLQRAKACGPNPRWKNSLCKLFSSGFRGLRDFLTLETGVVGMAFLLALIAGQISGNVLRRPNVTVYIAISAAYLFYLMEDFTGRRWKDEEDSF